MPDTYIKFRGMKAATDAIPEIGLGDIQNFVVTAECVQTGTEKRADGEERPVIGMKVMEVVLGEITPAPKDNQLPFHEDDDEIGDGA